MSRSASSTSGDLFIPTPQRETQDLLQFESPDKDTTVDYSFLRDKPLETCYDILCDNQTFQVDTLAKI